MSYQREFTDTADLHPWSSQTVFYNDLGQIEGRYQQLDAGGHFEIQYDPANLFAISKVTREYDAEGRLSREATNWDDGHRTVMMHDAAGNENWDSILTDYTAFGTILNRVMQFDDGHSVTMAYSGDELSNRIVSRTTQGTADHLYTAEFFSEDGSREVLQYDSGDRDWTSYGRSYDAAGQLTSTSIQYDDLHSLDTWYDAGDQHAWSRATQTGSYRNAEISTFTVNFDDGGHLVTRIDPVNGWSAGQIEPWATQVRVTDLHNDLAYSVQFNDDLTLVERFAGGAWHVDTTAEGAVQQRSLDLGNGVLLTLDYDTTHTQDWAMQMTLSNACGCDAFYVAAFGDDGVLHQTTAPGQVGDWLA